MGVATGCGCKEVYQTSQPGETAHSEISFSWAAGRLASPYRCHTQIPLLPFLPSQENTEENNDCKVKRPGPEQTESNCTFVRCTTTRLLYMVHSYVRCVQGVIKNLIFDRVFVPQPRRNTNARYRRTQVA